MRGARKQQSKLGKRLTNASAQANDWGTAALKALRQLPT